MCAQWGIKGRCAELSGHCIVGVWHFFLPCQFFSIQTLPSSKCSEPFCETALQAEQFLAQHLPLVDWDVLGIESWLLQVLVALALPTFMTRLLAESSAMTHGCIAQCWRMNVLRNVTWMYSRTPLQWNCVCGQKNFTIGGFSL